MYLERSTFFNESSLRSLTLQSDISRKILSESPLLNWVSGYGEFRISTAVTMTLPQTLLLENWDVKTAFRLVEPQR